MASIGIGAHGVSLRPVTGRPLSATARGSRAGELVQRFVVAIPDRLAIMALCTVVAVAICVQTQIFHPYTFFPLLVVLIAATWRMAPRAVVANRAEVIGVAVVLLVALLWLALNWRYFSELISVRRDPSIYTLRGFWLVDHPSPDVTLTQQLLDIRRQVKGVTTDFGGETNKLVRHFQSTTVVPGLIAIGGWFGGPFLLFKANLVIGAGVLITIYAIGRRMAGPLYGTLPVLALAACMPLAAFSRVPYTEPISMLVGLLGLLCLYLGWHEHRPAVWALAGAGIGATSLCRVDGALVLIGAIVGFGVLTGFAASREARRRGLIGLLWFLAGAVPLFALGYTDLRFHSPEYLYALRKQAYPLWAAAGGVTAVALLLGVLPIGAIGRWLYVRRVWLARMLAAVTAVGLIAMVARPLFLTARFSIGPYAIGVGNRQKAEGLPLDPSRSYDEQSVTWLSWYFGWPLVITAGLAVIAAVWWIIRRRDAGLLLVGAVAAVNAVAYLNYISITSDQIWAMRRFLPVIIPGMLLFAAWGAARLQDWAVSRFSASRAGTREPEAAALDPTVELPTVTGTGAPGSNVSAAREEDTLQADGRGRPRPAAARAVRIGLPVALALMLLFPVFSWGQMFTVREGAGQYDMVMSTCPKIAADNKVLVLGSLPDMGYYQPTYRNLCGSEVLALREIDAKGKALMVPKEKIAKIAALWGGTVTVVNFRPNQVPWTTPPTAPVAANSYDMWESTLSRRPSNPRPESTEIYMGTVQPDGSVTPLGG